MMDTLAAVQELRLRGDHQQAYAGAIRLLQHDGRNPLVRNEIGLLLKARGEYAAARRQYERAMRVTGPGDSDEAATLLHNLAGIRFVLDDPVGASRCGHQGLAMRRRLWGPDDLAVLLDEGNLAPILVALGEYDTAHRMLDRLLLAFSAEGAPADAEVAVTLTNLGALAARRDDWPAARDQLARAAAIKERLFGVDSPELIATLVNLAVVTERLGGDAGDLRARARGIARTLREGHPLREHVLTSSAQDP